MTAIMFRDKEGTSRRWQRKQTQVVEWGIYTIDKAVQLAETGV